MFRLQSDGSYALFYPAEASASLNVSDTSLVLQTRGETWNFYGFNQSDYAPGALQNVTRGGRTYTVNYNTLSQPRGGTASQLRDNGVPAGAVSGIAQSNGPENYQFAYNADGQLASVTLTRQLSGTVSNVAQLAVNYFTSTGQCAQAGDLQSRQTQVYDSQAQAWIAQNTTYYGYDPATGMVRFVLDGRQYDQLLADQNVPAGGDLNSIADPSTITSYAREAYTYDGEGRVATQSLDGGARVYSFQYALNDSPAYADGYNNWKYRTTETLTDAAGNLIHAKNVYMNFVGTLLLSQLTAEGNVWLEYKAYNDAGQVALDAQPSALTGFAIDGGLTIVPQYAASGLVRCYQYYTQTDVDNNTPTATHAGAVLGYLAYEQLQNGGDASTLTNLRQLQYIARSGSGIPTYYPVGSVTQYADGQSPITTSYSYPQWWGNTAQVLERVTSLPIVPETQNGSGVQLTRDEYFDAQGKLTWALDERGRIAYRRYDPLTEALVESIDDCNGADGAGNSLVLPWTPPSDALQAVTDITVDPQGRPIEVLGPVHAAVGPGNTALSAVRTGQWTLYDDANYQVIRAQGYQDTTNNGAVTLVDPVSLTIRDKYQRVIDEVQAAAAGDLTVSNHALLLSTAIDQGTWAAGRTRIIATYGPTGGWNRPRSTTIYPTGSATPPATATTGSTGRTRSRLPAGRSPARRSIPWADRSATYVGADDTHATDSDPTGGTVGRQAGNNMVQLAASVYDGGGAGDGNLTSTTKFMADPTLNRVTTFAYDWRDRLTTTIGMEGSCQVQGYDNLDRLILTQRFDTTPTGALLAQSATSYDDRGRVYQTLNYSVSGGQLGPALAAYTWYDQANNVIKQQAPGSNLFTKTVYDGLGRAPKPTRATT